MSKIIDVIFPCKKCLIREECISYFRGKDIYTTCAAKRAKRGLPKAEIKYVREE